MEWRTAWKPESIVFGMVMCVFPEELRVWVWVEFSLSERGPIQLLEDLREQIQKADSHWHPHLKARQDTYSFGHRNCRFPSIWIQGWLIPVVHAQLNVYNWDSYRFCWGLVHIHFSVYTILAIYVKDLKVLYCDSLLVYHPFEDGISILKCGGKFFVRRYEVPTSSHANLPSQKSPQVLGL